MIPIYQTEINDGLQPQIEASTVIAYCAELLPVSEFEIDSDLADQIAKATNLDQLDLHYYNSTLVSVGWNKNDDVFDAQDTWVARNTPVHKPVNYMHDALDIIGHMTKALVLDERKQLIPDDTPVDNVPSSFDIIVGSVLYKHWPNQEKQERMDKIIAEIAKGEWYVSMECLFRNFDYALSRNGENKIHRRSADTAFLTKHLRVYGGSGEWDGYKVGRVLRDFTFSGKGLVRNPANPRSVIFTEVNPFVGAEASTTTITKGNSMPDITETQYNELKARLDEALEQNKTLASQLKDLDAQKIKEQIQVLESTISDLQEQVKEKDKLVASQEEAIADLEKEVTARQEKLDSVSEELTKTQADVLNTKRLMQLTEAGVEADKAEALVTKWAGATDEMFAELVELAGKKPPWLDKEKDKDKNKDDAKADDDDSADADADDLDDAKADVTADINAGGDTTESLRAVASTWLQESVLRTTANLKEEEK